MSVAPDKNVTAYLFAAVSSLLVQAGSTSRAPWVMPETNTTKPPLRSVALFSHESGWQQPEIHDFTFDSA